MKELTASTGRIAAFAALNRKNSGVKWQITGKIAALTAFFVGIKALKAFIRKNSGVNGVQSEK